MPTQTRYGGPRRGALDEIGEGLAAEVVFLATPVAIAPRSASSARRPRRPADVVVSDVEG